MLNGTKIWKAIRALAKTDMSMLRISTAYISPRAIMRAIVGSRLNKTWCQKHSLLLHQLGNNKITNKIKQVDQLPSGLRWSKTILKSLRAKSIRSNN